MSFFDGRIGATTGPTTGYSSSTQSALVYFQPAGDSGAPIVSVQPAGQGLSTINNALPGSAAWGYGGRGAGAGSPPAATSSLAGLVLLAAIAGGAWLVLRKGRR